ncbi:50S ribosomal protein L5 [Euphorbia peplus]|nr:50S ribosomal protein L5 [Euphorbia peplus]
MPSPILVRMLQTGVTDRTYLLFFLHLCEERKVGPYVMQNISFLLFHALQMMRSFLDRLINLELPRTFDLQCSTPSSFDGHRNYRIRIQRQNMFPEDRYDEIGKLKGVNVCIKTSMKTNEETQNLLAFVGKPLGDNTAMEEVEQSLS